VAWAQPAAEEKAPQSAPAATSNFSRVVDSALAEKLKLAREQGLQGVLLWVLDGAGEPPSTFELIHRHLRGEQAGKAAVQHFGGAKVEKYAWGSIRWLMDSKTDPSAEMTLGIVEIEPRQANALHVHPNCAEYLHVLAGSCEHRVGDQWVSLKAGDTLRIPKGVAHSARTLAEPCRAMVLYNVGKRQVTNLEEKGK
jgi:quercetin dioxygenase-like cupin family protein